MLGFDRPTQASKVLLLSAPFSNFLPLSRNCFECSMEKTETARDSMEIGKEDGRKWESGIETTYNIWRLKIHWTLEAFNNAIIAGWRVWEIEIHERADGGVGGGMKVKFVLLFSHRLCCCYCETTLRPAHNVLRVWGLPLTRSRLSSCFCFMTSKITLKRCRSVPSSCALLASKENSMFDGKSIAFWVSAANE